MSPYERGWTAVAGPAGAAALTGAVTSSAVLPLVGLFACVGLLSVLFVLPWLTPSTLQARTLVLTGVGAGSLSVVCFGLAQLVGAWTLPLMLVLVMSAPMTAPLWSGAARVLGWRAPHRRGATTPHAPATDSDTSHLGAVLVGLAVVVPPAGQELQVPDEMTNADLCQAWRSSFVALEQAGSADDRLRVVQLRARYLDELERRAGPSFGAWLRSGARAAGDPSAHLSWDRGGP